MSYPSSKAYWSRYNDDELKDEVMVFFFPALIKQGLFDLKLQHVG